MKKNKKIQSGKCLHYSISVNLYKIQDNLYIYVTNSRPNGWTGLKFLWTLRGSGFPGAKKYDFFVFIFKKKFLQNYSFFSTGNAGPFSYNILIWHVCLSVCFKNTSKRLKTAPKKGNAYKTQGRFMDG